MAITDSKTVLILGAGTSAPFGLSLGGSIIDQLRTTLESEYSALHTEENMTWGLDRPLLPATRSVSGYLRFSIYGSVARQHLTSDGGRLNASVKEDLRRLEKLSELLAGQTSETIDDFIVENPSLASITKIGIAALFVRSCFDKTGNKLMPKTFQDRHYADGDNAPTRNWIHLLINIVRQGIRADRVSPRNKIKIVTFNYDKILEYVLDRQFGNTEAGYARYTDYIEIIHVHGQCGDLLKTANPAEMVCQWANGIHVVNEPTVPDDVLKNRHRAKEIVQSARELYFCGFSFSKPNCDLLGLESSRAEGFARTISFCNYDGNAGLSYAANRYKNDISVMARNEKNINTKIVEAKGSVGQELGVTDWLRLGHVGDLPG